MKKLPAYREPSFHFKPRTLSYNEQCAATGGRAYESARVIVPEPAEVTEADDA